MRANTRPDDRILVTGTDPEVYWLATSDPIRDTPRREQALRAHNGNAWAALESLATEAA